MRWFHRARITPFNPEIHLLITIIKKMTMVFFFIDCIPGVFKVAEFDFWHENILLK